jgi:hypothetical protein
VVGKCLTLDTGGHYTEATHFVRVV